MSAIGDDISGGIPGPDSIIVDIIRGLPQTLKTRVDTWEVLGLDGYGAQTLGLGDAEFNLVTVYYATTARATANSNTPSEEANAHIENMNAWQGQTVSVLDDWADQYDNIVVKHVDSSKAKMPMIKDGAFCVRVELHWQMCHAFEPADS